MLHIPSTNITEHEQEQSGICLVFQTDYVDPSNEKDHGGGTV